MKKLLASAVVFLMLPLTVLAHSGSHKKVMGTVSKVEASRLHLTAKDGKDVHVPLTAKTKYLHSGKVVAGTHLTPGMRVVVELSKDGTAELVRIGKSGAAPAHK